MAEIYFFITDDEAPALIAFLLSEFGVTFVPEKNPSPKIPELRSIEAIQSHRATNKYADRYFLISDQWTHFPLHLRELRSKGHHYYYIEQRCGGPAFDLIVGRAQAADGLEWIVPSSLSDYPWYNVDESCQRTIARPEAMKTAFTEIARFIRRGGCSSQCQEVGFLGPHITRGALAAFKRGVWLRAGDRHFIPRKISKQRR